ncbi:MAG: PilZ domain-containing protein [Nitrospira sp.]
MDQQMSAGDMYEHGLTLKRVQMFDQAIDDFKRAALDPQYASKAQVQIALCLKAAGRHEDAIAAFRQVSVLPTLSSEERRHVSYHMAQLLESLGRHDESLEIYGRIKKEDPGFRDVARRIRQIGSGEAGTNSSQGMWDGLMDEVKTRSRHLKPLWEQTGQWLSTTLGIGKAESRPSVGGSRRVQPSQTSARVIPPAARPRASEKRRYKRVPVQLQSRFSAKGRVMTGEGELRDLSLWGCRVTSATAVPVGAEIECCIYPQNSVNPFFIDRATVQWINAREFGLSFTSVRPGVQKQIAQLCRLQAV